MLEAGYVWPRHRERADRAVRADEVDLAGAGGPSPQLIVAVMLAAVAFTLESVKLATTVPLGNGTPGVVEKEVPVAERNGLITTAVLWIVVDWP